MKRILITGKGSYIGSSFHSYLDRFPNDYYVEELDMVDESWRNFDFSGYDVVYHVAGIAHIKEKKENKELYFKVNRDLAIEVAKKAKEEGVHQFIFMSSMSVYGLNFSKSPITLNSNCNPNSYYGKSKWEAEKAILLLEDNKFKICVLRPPMVYGSNSPGNMNKLIDFVKKIHFFPKIYNKRSYVSIEVLINFVLDLIKKNQNGIYLPQNDKYLCTYEIIKNKMKEENIPVIYLRTFNLIIYFLVGKVKIISKIFGDLYYQKVVGGVN